MTPLGLDATPARVVVFGGAGDMGSRAVEALIRQEDVGLVTVADRDEEAALALDPFFRTLAREGLELFDQLEMSRPLW